MCILFLVLWFVVVIFDSSQGIPAMNLPVASLALWESCDCPKASDVRLEDMVKIDWYPNETQQSAKYMRTFVGMCRLMT